MENVVIKTEEVKPAKKVAEKRVKKSVDEIRIEKMSKDQKATLVEFMELRNEARANQGMPMAYSEEEIKKYR